MKREQWEEIFSAVAKQEDLNKDNVIEKIKEELKKRDEGVYEQWKKADFAVRHEFEAKDEAKDKVDRGVLAFLALGYGYYTVVFQLLALTQSKDYIKTDSITIQDPRTKEQPEFARANEETHSPQNNDERVTFLMKEADLLLNDSNYATPRDLSRDDSTRVFLKNTSEEMSKLGKKTTNLPRNSAGRNDLLKGAEEKKPISAAKKGIYAGGAVVVLGTATAVALFASGIIAVELVPIVIAVATIAVAALAASGIAYKVSRPSTKVGETKETQVRGGVQHLSPESN